MPTAAFDPPLRRFDMTLVCELADWVIMPFGPKLLGLCACCAGDILSDAESSARSSDRFRNAEFMAERNPRSFSIGAVCAGTSIAREVLALIGPGFGLPSLVVLLLEDD